MRQLMKEERRAWLAERRQGIGASDAPIILGLSPWKSPLALFTEKLNLAHMDDVEGEQELKEYQRWGLRLEDAVAVGFGEETGRDIITPPNPFHIDRHPDLPFMQATLDRRQKVVDGCELPPFVVPEEQGVLECKTAIFFKSEEWVEEAPLQYQVQLQHQMFVTGAKWGSLAVLIGGNTFRYQDFERNESFIKLLVTRCREFWDRVQTGRPPDPDGHRSTREALHRMFPQALDLDVVPLPEQAEQWIAMREEGKQAEAEAKAKIDLAENHIKALLQNNVAGITPSGKVVQWKVEPRAGYTVQPSEPRVLRVKEPPKGRKKGKR